ncbi:MAG TPA: transglycosylase SLT domain-containing protein [Chitinivibrionales bacterium]|nr:transglycosylase SLT domain-containing protein [Chitinivibrionales bacterium]
MSTTPSAQALRLGLLVHGNKIWISEFLSIFLVSSVLLVFFALTLLIIINETLLHANEQRIATLSSQKQAMVKMLADVSSTVKIMESMRAVLGARVPSQTCAQLAGLVKESSSAFGYDPLLLLAVIEVESKFSARASGKYRSGIASGAFGLMQLKLETAQEIAASLGMKVSSARDLYRPEVNVALGVAYLTQLIAQFKSFKLGLLAYNQGPGVILEQLASQQPLSIDYYHRVLRKYYKFRAVTDSLELAGINNK